MKKFILLSLISIISLTLHAQEKPTSKSWTNSYKVKIEQAGSGIEYFFPADEYPWWGENGMIPVRVGRLWGYADTNARIIIAPEFKEVDYFHEGLAVARRGKKFGYIDTSGKVVIPMKYTMAVEFKEGKAEVFKGKGKRVRMFLIDREGRILERF